MYQRAIISRPSPFKTAPSTLADDGCASNDYAFRDVWVWFTGGLGNSYNNAISVIAQRANWNSGWGCRLAPGTDCYRTATVECVLNSYVNLVKAGEIPEYDRSNPAIKEKVETMVASNSLMASGKVRRIMLELWDATRDGSIPSFVLKPKTAEKTQNWGVRPDGTQYAEPNVPNPFTAAGAILQYLPYAVVAAGAIAMVYYGSRVASIVRS